MTLCKDSPEGIRDVFSNKLIDPINGTIPEKGSAMTKNSSVKPIPENWIEAIAGLTPRPKSLPPKRVSPTTSEIMTDFFGDC